MLHTTFSHACLTLYHVSLDFIRFLGSLLQSRSVLVAENLFLRKQLALYQERQVRPRRATDATRLTMVWLGRLFDWYEAAYRFLIHDRDKIYSQELGRLIEDWGVKVLKTPFRSPQANSYCEHLIGSLRRGCLDFLIPMNGRHLGEIPKEYKTHYN